MSASAAAGAPEPVTARPRIVMVTKFLPLPANSGGKLRSAAVLRRLAAVGDVVLCAFDDGQADREALDALGVDVRAVPWRPPGRRALTGLARTGTVSAARFWDPALARQVAAALAEAPTDVLQVEYGHLAPYLSLGTARRRVLDLHNVEHDLMRSRARSATGARAAAARAEAVLLRRLERRALRVADAVVVVSERDARRLPGRAARVLLCPNGWDASPPLPPAEAPVVVFVALLGWGPNAEAARWLVREVWPHVRRHRPDARLRLVGRAPGPDVRALAGGDVEVVPDVADVRPYLREARVAVAPLLSGGGTRLKILEALDAGRPVVATTVGCEGLEDLVGAGVVAVDTPAEFGAEVARLLDDPARAAALAELGRRVVAGEYSWDAVLAPLLAEVAR